MTHRGTWANDDYLIHCMAISVNSTALNSHWCSVRSAQGYQAGEDWIENGDHTEKPTDNATEKHLIPYPFVILILGKIV